MFFLTQIISIQTTPSSHFSTDFQSTVCQPAALDRQGQTVLFCHCVNKASFPDFFASLRIARLFVRGGDAGTAVFSPIHHMPCQRTTTDGRAKSGRVQLLPDSCSVTKPLGVYMNISRLDVNTLKSKLLFQSQCSKLTVILTE